MWAAKAYPSLKPLSSWVTDLMERLDFIRTWAEQGTPPVYWINCKPLDVPAAGTIQNFARKYTFPIDTVSFDFKVMDSLTANDLGSGPDDGCYIKVSAAASHITAFAEWLPTHTATSDSNAPAGAAGRLRPRCHTLPACKAV